MAFSRRETAILLIGDFLLLVASLWIALTLRNLALPSISHFEANVVPFLPMFIISLVVFYIAGLYEKQTRPIRRVMGIRIFNAQVANTLIGAILFFILPLNIAPKTILLLYLLASLMIVTAWRFYRIRREVATSARTPALLIGHGPAVHELFEEVNGNSRFLLHFITHVDASSILPGTLSRDVQQQIDSGAKAVVLDTSNPRIAEELPHLYDLIAKGITFVDFASFYEEIFDRVPLAHISIEHILQTLPKRYALYDLAKRIFDLVFGILCSVIAAPFVFLAAVLLALQGGSPFIYHTRIGRGGRLVKIVKLRSMLFDDHGDRELHLKNRITPLGKILRKSRIDELPQLWNVIKGELSFIGPRPEIPIIAEVYDREVPFYRMRHAISPGLSGWAQIHDYDAPRGVPDVERTKRKLSFDLYYLKHRSFGLDVAITLKTVRALLSFSGT
jgi:lipopolysaccharide/colanic/teichoic acid biosynthesis glycosyltransferase